MCVCRYVRVYNVYHSSMTGLHFYNNPYCVFAVLAAVTHRFLRDVTIKFLFLKNSFSERFQKNLKILKQLNFPLFLRRHLLGQHFWNTLQPGCLDKPTCKGYLLRFLCLQQLFFLLLTRTDFSPQDFDPLRFDPTKRKHLSSHTFIPFSSGPRYCPLMMVEPFK